MTISSSIDVRFSIASLMWTTGTVAVLLTYYNFFQPAEFLMGMKVVGVVAIVGTAIGIFFRRVAGAVYWSVLGAMTAFLCAVGEPLTHASFQYAWPLVGALTATTAVMFDRSTLVLRATIGALVGFVVLAIFSLVAMSLGAANTWTEVICGPLAGAIMVCVVWLLETLRTWRNYPRSQLIFALTVGVIGGNVLGRWTGWL